MATQLSPCSSSLKQETKLQVVGSLLSQEALVSPHGCLGFNSTKNPCPEAFSSQFFMVMLEMLSLKGKRPPFLSRNQKM
ncbi:hypothetical protein ACOSQ2_002924 [Xanthoceras sorbifolium]